MGSKTTERRLVYCTTVIILGLLTYIRTTVEAVKFEYACVASNKSLLYLCMFIAIAAYVV